MKLSEAMKIMEQAVMLVVKNCQDIQSAKTMIEAWDMVRPPIEVPEGESDAYSNTDTDNI